jgi:hypothetical protein
MCNFDLTIFKNTNTMKIWRMKMKALILVISFVLFLEGCDTGISKGDFEVIENNENLAVIKIPIPKLPFRTIIGSDDLSKTDFYKVKLYKRSGTWKTYSTTANEDDEYLQIQVVPGVYDIVLFAGIKVGNGISFSSDNKLLASGYVSEANILLGDNTFSIVLRPIDRSFELPMYVETGAEFSGHVTFDSRNPFIKISACVIYIVSTDTPQSFDSFAMYGNTAVAPLTPGNGRAVLYTGYGYVETDEYSDTSDMCWSLPFESPIVFYDSNNNISSVNIDIYWETN